MYIVYFESKLVPVCLFQTEPYRMVFIANNNSKVKEVKLASPEQKHFDNQVFPLILQPDDDINKETLTSIDDTLQWIKEEKTEIENHLLKHGAILFRGFHLEKPADFDNFVKMFGYDPFPYIGGAAPRTLVVGNVFTANESPPDAAIPFHHEMAQVPNYPKVIFFYCDNNPPEGGQTPLVVSNLAYQKMKEQEPEFVTKLEELGVKYNRVLPNGDDPSSPIGRGWQSTYGTDDKADAEQTARELVDKVEWMPDGCMRTATKVLPAVLVDERTGNKTWFNSIIAVYKGWKDSRNSPESSVTFGDGSPMPPKVMDRLEHVLNDLAIDFKWKNGDVVMIDNRQVLHGRRPFVPPRKILACLCK